MAEAGKRKKDRWGLFLLIWALVLLLLGVGCCCFLYRYLDVYEKTRPEPVVDAYLAQNGAEQLMKAAQSNVQLDVTEFANAARSHWGVENSLHWCLDVTFREDHSRMRKDHSAENFAVVRHIVLNVLKNMDDKLSVARRRRRCAYDDAYLEKVLRSIHA